MVARILSLFLLLSGIGFAQTTTTLTFTVNPSPCQPSVGAPRYYCLGSVIGPSNVVSEWSIYTGLINPGGSFDGSSGSFLGITDFAIPNNNIYIDSSTINGTEDPVSGVLNGTFSGTVSGGTTGTFTAAFVNLTPGGIRKCNRWRTYCTTQRAIVSGTIVVTVTQ